MNEHLALLLAPENAQILEKCATFMRSVGRIPKLGSCCLISLQSATSALLLTSSNVANHIAECPSDYPEAIFLEEATMSMAIRPTKIKLTPQKFLFSSAHDYEEVGYGLISCEIISNSGGRALSSLPVVPMPMMPSKASKTQVGDVHLLVIHPKGMKRKLQLVSVEAVFEHHCTYRQSEILGFKHLASGGTAFDINGKFIGVVHQTEDFTSTVFAVDIVRHLFQSHLLHNVVLPIEEGAPDLVDRFDIDGALHHSNGAIYDQDLWKEWAAGFETTQFIAIVFSFPYHEAILMKAIRELSSHKNRSDFILMAQKGGIDAVLLAMKRHPNSAPLNEVCVMGLAPFTAFDINRTTFVELGGVSLLASAMKEYHNCDTLLQWGALTVSNVIAPNVAGVESRKRAVMESGVVLLLAQSLSRFPNSAYLYRWTAMMFGNLVANNPFVVDDIVNQYNVLHLLVVACRNSALADAMEELMYAILRFVEDTHSATETIINLLMSKDLMGIIVECLLKESITHSQLWEHCANVVFHVCNGRPLIQARAFEFSIDTLLWGCVQRHKSNISLQQSVVRVLSNLGVQVEEKFRHRME